MQRQKTVELTLLDNVFSSPLSLCALLSCIIRIYKTVSVLPPTLPRAPCAQSLGGSARSSPEIV